MAKDRYAPKTLDDLMANMSSRMSSYVGKSQQLNQHQELLTQCVGATMAQKCRISNYRDSILIIEAESAAVAMRLNYMKMSILSDLRKNGLADLCQIKIQTSPRAAADQQAQKKRAEPIHNSRVLSQQTADALLEVAEHAPASLKAKLEKLAALSKKNK